VSRQRNDGESGGRKVWDDARVPSLTVACPAYNEEQSIERVAREVLEFVPRLTSDFELLIVDDGSTDATGDIADRLARTDSRIRVIHHPYNLGFIGFAMTNIRNAAKDCMVGISADGEVPIETLARQFELIRAGYEVVIAHRVRKPNYTPYRKLISHFYNTSVRMVFDVDLRDAGSTKMYRTYVLRETVPISRSPFLNAELLVKASLRGRRIGFVEVEQQPRLGGKAKGGNWKWVAHSAVDLARVAWQIKTGRWRP
jgi:glycosyltransferase involved in cell wall biosynthesis